MQGPSAAPPLFNRSLPPWKPAPASPQVCRLISFYTCGDKIDSLLIPVFPLAVTSPAAEPVAARLTSVRRRKRCRGRPGTEGEGRGRRYPDVGGYIWRVADFTVHPPQNQFTHLFLVRAC